MPETTTTDQPTSRGTKRLQESFLRDPRSPDHQDPASGPFTAFRSTADTGASVTHFTA